MNDLGHERKCAVCRKPFIIYPGWAYKHGTGEHKIVFCSWSCLRKWESGQGTSRERRQTIIRALQDGLNPKEVSILLGEELR